MRSGNEKVQLSRSPVDRDSLAQAIHTNPVKPGESLGVAHRAGRGVKQ